MGVDLEVDELDGERLAPFQVEKRIRLMQAPGANINAQDERGCAPLHLAAKFGNHEIAPEVSPYQAGSPGR